uniref:Uncharacterized protein n=1 Tax=Globodera rostochiensis TaxID=31243 RepID=A0A914H041_GLORO
MIGIEIGSLELIHCTSLTVGAAFAVTIDHPGCAADVRWTATTMWPGPNEEFGRSFCCSSQGCSGSSEIRNQQVGLTGFSHRADF